MIVVESSLSSKHVELSVDEALTMISKLTTTVQHAMKYRTSSMKL